MAKLEKQYKGTKGSTVNLPNLSVSTAKPLGAATASQVYDAMTQNISKMQVFLEDRAKSAAVEAGFQYSLLNTPTDEEINNMIPTAEDPDKKAVLPFKSNSMNVAEQTARVYIGEEIRFKAEQITTERLHKYFTQDVFNKGGSESEMSLDEMHTGAKEIIDNSAKMFSGNRNTYNSFVDSMKIYATAKMKENLGTRNALYNARKESDLNTSLATIKEDLDAIYSVGGFKAVNQKYKSLEKWSESTAGSKSEAFLQKIKKEKDVAVQKLSSDQMKKYFDDVPDLNNPNLPLIQKLVSDIGEFYEDEPEKGLAVLTNSIISASDDEAGMLKLDVLENTIYKGKKVSEYEYWDDFEREAIISINKNQEEFLTNRAKKDTTTVSFIEQDVLKNLKNNPELRTRSGLKTYFLKFLNDKNLTMEPNKIEVGVDLIENSIRNSTPDLSIESLSDIKRGLRKESTQNKKNIAQTGESFLNENYLSVKDRKQLTDFINNYQNVDNDEDYKIFGNITKARINLNPLQIGNEAQLARVDETKDFYITHVLTKNLKEIKSTMSRNNIDIKEDEFANLISTNVNILLNEILENRKETLGNDNLILEDITYESLDNDSKRKIAAAMTFHGQFLFITGFKDDDFFKMFMQDETVQQRNERIAKGVSFFDILSSQHNEIFTTKQELKEGQTITVPTDTGGTGK